MSAIYLQENDSDLSQTAEGTLLTGCNNQHAISQAVTLTSQHYLLLKDLLWHEPGGVAAVIVNSSAHSGLCQLHCA